MANPDGELTVAQRLGRALDRGLFPAGGPAEAAERLIERLERPARVALLGLPGAGKSSVLNLLVGSTVVPETLRLPTIIVQHGDVARMLCTLTDGTTKIVPGSDLSQALPLAPALVTLEMDLPALRVISLLEVSAGPMEAEQKRAATWASKRADIVIWCTTSYLPKEQAVWESLPDAVKDNSFMLLTKVDLLGGRESAQAMHDRVELRAGEEFRQILSVSAKQARAAMPPGGEVNRELFRDSGAGAVISAIKTRVQSGRRADMDTAELLLARHVEASELVAKRFADDEAAASRVWTPPPEPEPVAETTTAPAHEPPETPDPSAEQVEAEGESAAALQAEPEPEVLPEAEPEPEPEPGRQAGSEAPEAEAEDVAEPIQPPAPEPVAEPEAAPPTETGTRRRFADRIKRVAADGDAAASPMVPLRTTWKSKAETEAASQPPAPPEPEPEPLRESTRRPRANAAQPVAEESPPAAVEPVEPDFVTADPDPVALAPVEPPAVEEPEVEEVAPPERVARRERPAARAVTSRPVSESEPEPARVARQPLFGGRRPVATGRDAPLPDLSSLRATPEEMEAALEESGSKIDAPEEGVAEASLPKPADQPDDLAAPVPEPVTEAPPAELPRLFDREPRGRPAEPAPELAETRLPRATPLSRSPRVSVTTPPEPVVSPAPLASAAVDADEDQFSPRSIMRREPRAPADPLAPRRERMRVAARAVPNAPVAAVAAPVSAVEQTLVEEAVALIASRSAELLAEIDPEAKVPVDTILDHARETGEQVQSVVARGRSEELRRINSDMGEVMDLIMLMQLEKGHAPADDALTLLLQLKRELETLRAE